jgi:tRNA dimethylallyltransferase
VTAPRGRLFILAGPTASGKTAEAVRLAHALGGPERVELVGADSVQVYKGLSIGSAAPRPEELRGLTHHLVGVVELTEPFDASRFVALADPRIDDIRARGKVPLVVGGTGLYLQALIRGLAPGIPRDQALRSALEARAGTQPSGLAGLHAELATLDPDYAAKIHPTDRIRIIRALEVCRTTGVPYSEHHRQHRAQGPRYDAWIAALSLRPELLRARIEARTRSMLNQGWLDELEALLKQGYSSELKPFQTVGQRQLMEYIKGSVPRTALEGMIVKATWTYARQQRTWLRGMEGVTWEAPGALPSPEGVERVRAFLAGGSASGMEG